MKSQGKETVPPYSLKTQNTSMTLKEKYYSSGAVRFPVLSFFMHLSFAPEYDKDFTL